MKLVNPFPTRDYISSEYFCDRHKELSQLIESIENQRNITLISQRKIGKTALIKHLFHTLKDRKDLSIHYFDIFPTQNIKEFSNLLCNSLVGYFESKPEKILKQLLNVIGRFRPKFTLDEYTGKPAIELSLQSETETGESLSTLFRYLDNQNRQIVLAIDEFQQITEYPEKNVEALLRSHIQASKNISMIYAGSNRDMLISLFNNHSRPFYQSSGFLFLDKLDALVYKEFISRHFRKAGRTISEEGMDFILEYTLGITYYVQDLCNRLFASHFRKIGSQEVNMIIRQVLEERTALYIVIRDVLTTHQFRLLVALAKEIYTEKPLASSFITGHHLGAQSTVQRSLEALENKNLVFREDGRYTLTDVFLIRWLQHYF